MTTDSPIRRQYAKNLVCMREMLAKAEAVAPKKYRGYTAAKLRELVAKFEAIVAMTDEELRAHLEGTIFARFA